MELRKLNHGSVVMKQGDQAAAMFFIKCGRVRVLRCIKSGPIARLLTLDPLLSARYPTTELHELHEHLAPPLTARSSLSSYRPYTSPSTPRPMSSSMRRPGTGSSGDAASSGQQFQQSGAGTQGEVWIEMGTLGQHESFGEIAAYKGATRSATVVCLVPTELLIITRHDLLTSVQGETRAKLESMSSSYMSDANLLRKLREQLSWERYKHRLVAASLYESRNLQLLAPLERADHFNIQKSLKIWR
ncbi:hypothetical protein WJX84_002132 [Apatococcus fuscideae]|uniref:Cyclic nucleotide-binding domain-containing protein n=1 Tax=Apatococcus fuscideae TaxID=2026836 RepID=A0AAW1T0A2_9CHLO